MTSKFKISKSNLKPSVAQEQEPVAADQNAAVDAPVEAAASEPVSEPTAEDYGKGGVYRSIGGGKRVRV